MMQNNSQTRENLKGVVVREVFEKERTHLISQFPNYVLIDAALWVPEIDVAKGFCSDFRSLFRGKAGEELNDVAPFLFPVDAESEFRNWLEYKISKDAENRRVLWISSSATLDELRRHFRRFLRIKTEDGGYMFFRLYDPMVLNYVLPNLKAKQCLDLFSAVSYFKTSADQMGQERYYYYSDLEEKIVMYKK